jgi:hypothetical protein
MTSSHRRPLLFVAATLGALAPAAGALAASASAATLQADRACYVNTNPAVGAPMTITGSGFTPGDTIDVNGGDVSTTGTVGTNGVFTATAMAPILSTRGPGTLKTTLTATDETTGAAVVSTVVESANLAVDVSRTTVQNVRKDKVVFSFSGFEPGKRIYAFYIHGRSRARARFNRTQGPCGTLRERALLYPGGRPRNDRYKVVFEDTSRYSATAFPRVTGQLQILHF